MTTTTTEQALREMLTVMWLDKHIELTDGPDDIADVVAVGEAAINAALDAKPDNWDLRELYADWLEAQGNPRCDSQRWMVANQYHPYYNKSERIDTQWMAMSQTMSVSVHIHKAMTGNGKYRWTMYPTRLAAEIDLHNALVKAGEITCALIEDVQA